MKKSLKRHAWTVRIIVLALLATAFVLAMVRIRVVELRNAATLSESEFAANVASSRAIVAEKERRIVEAQEISNTHRDPTKIDVVVNKKNPLVPIDYIPSVVSVDCAGNGTITVQELVKDDLTALCDAANAAGVPLTASTAYRSYDFQSTLYNQYVAESGQAEADTFSARPGYSEHQTGFAVDFRVPNGAKLSDFTGTAQQKWLAVHGPEYGFIQRYTEANSSETGYDAESWHYRYIGRENAAAYLASGKASLEDFWGMPGGDY